MKRFFSSAFILFISFMPLAAQNRGPRPEAVPGDKLTILPGFKVERIRNAAPTEGSWISMTVDGKGRLIISPQDMSGLLRITLDPDGQVQKVDRIPGFGIAMGMLYAFDSLYVVGVGPESKNPGDVCLYRLRDTNGDDVFDDVKALRHFEGGSGEHGSHGIVLGPDGKSLYLIHGNFVKVPPWIDPQSPHRNFADDLILPRAEDGRGFGVGLKPPGGFLLKTDAEGSKWEMVAAGMRNTYDIAFNPDGELFGFDSDMEWDIGMPWYRPTRILHLVSAGDYGFREGSGKWPTYYPDSLPPVVDIGLGSPTGVKFGTDARFPAKYKKALFAMDWTHGRILAVHLKPGGASYTGQFETFISGKPLPVTDLEFGKDGAMYFTIGGRGGQSGLYRVTYSGSESTSGPVAVDQSSAAGRKLRHDLEKLHGRKDPKAVDFLWPHLNDPDRFIRYAARIALESQDVATWRDRALQEPNIDGGLTALLALARVGPKETLSDLVEQLGNLAQGHMNERQTLEALRVLQVALVRLGPPDSELAGDLQEALDSKYPSDNEWVNRELCQLLVYLQSPNVVKKTIPLLTASRSQEEQIHYVFTLRHQTNQWTLEDRQLYFGWFHYDRRNLEHLAEPYFQQVNRAYGDGASVANFIANMKRDAVEKLDDKDRASLAPIITGQVVVAPPAPPKRERKFVKEWRMDDLAPYLEQVGKGRSFKKGREAFQDAQCLTCHRFATGGGAVGPDITAAASRFSRRDILESILEPSKVISDQYQNTLIVKKDETEFTGRPLEENDAQVVLQTDPVKQTKVTIQKSDIARRNVSKVSPMPEGLVNNLTRDEILDLLAYIESGGNALAPIFQQ